MVKKADHNLRKRVVVEEINEEPIKTEDVKPVEEIKEKVEELQEITEHIGSDVEKSVDVQEEIAEVAEKAIEKPTTEPQTPIPPPQPLKGPSPLFILIPGVLLLGALLGGIYFYQKGITQTSEPTAIPQAVETATPAPTADDTSLQIDYDKYPIKVLNGSGIPGVASTGKDLLTKAGFSVSSTGNADNYKYTDTIIQAGADVPKAYLTKLSQSLAKSYKVAEVESPSGIAKDAVTVIIGSSKAE